MLIYHLSCAYSQLCVCVSGFVTPGPLASRVFDTPYTTPTLHVLGRTDVVVGAERSRPLLAVSACARVEEHAGGKCYRAQL
jgi:hypothetical protein